MKSVKKFIGLFGLLLLNLALTGCLFAGVRSVGSYDVPTPPPVTPIVPPAGIRGTISVDPRHLMSQDESQRLAAEARLYKPTIIDDASGSLHFCNSGFGYSQEAHSESMGQFKGMVGFTICGWSKKKADVEVRIIGSDGSFLHKEVVTTQESHYERRSNMASIFYPVNVTEQETVVLVEFVGEDGVFSAEYTITLPTEPRIYTYETGDAWLYGFEAGERVQLLRYDVSERGYVEWESGGGITETYTLVDAQTMTVEPDGTLAAYEIAAAGYGPYGPLSILLVIGEQTGELSHGHIGFVEGTVFEE